MDLMRNGWWQAESVSTLTGYGMNLAAIRVSLTTPPENFFAATYAQPGGMRAGFAQFAAFSQDAKDNRVFEETKLTMPVMAVGGEKSFGPMQAVIMRHVATNVQEEVVAGYGRLLMGGKLTYRGPVVLEILYCPLGFLPGGNHGCGRAKERSAAPSANKVSPRGQ